MSTLREQLKAERRQQLLIAGARLIAEKGFLGVRLEDLGAAVGISGPAVYRHFPSKEALLVELLADVSIGLRDGAETVVTQAQNSRDALAALIDFHLDFALGKPDLIRIQDRDLENLPETARRRVRRSQREYVEIWVGVLRELDSGLRESDARVKAHATFGLINSTPHSASRLSATQVRPILRRMALTALASGKVAIRHP